MYKIIFYAPVDFVETIKQAIFDAGAGKIGNYACCAWQVLGEGQYMPLENSNAFAGQINQVEKAQEYKVELVCDEIYITQVIAALKSSHPYEEPAYQVIKVENF